MKFIDDFVAYASEFTGCPKPFLEWSAILCLSVVAGRRHTLRRGDWDIHPNLWVMLLGQSSSYKSTGLAIARRLLREVIPDAILGQEYSSEKLLDDIAANPHRLFVYDEAETFFKMLTQSYNPTLKSAVMTLWRDDWYVRKTKKADVVIKDAYLCWGGASTPVQMTHQLNSKDSDLLSGMFPRFLLVPYFGSETSVKDPPPFDPSKRQALVAQLKNLVTLGEREYAYSTLALKMKSQWLDRFEVRRQDADSLLAAFFKKMKDEHFHKLAMLSAFERESSVIEPRDLEEVIPRLWQIEESLPDLLESMTSDEWSRKLERIEKYVKKQGECSRSDLMNKLRLKGFHLEKLLQSLQLDGKIKRSKEATSTKPVEMIRWII